MFSGMIQDVKWFQQMTTECSNYTWMHIYEYQIVVQFLNILSKVDTSSTKLFVLDEWITFMYIYIVFNTKTIKYITNQSNFFTYYPLCLFYLVWRSSDYKYFLRRIWRWSPIQLTVCTSLLINLFDCLTSYTIKEYSKNLIISHFLMEEDNSEHIIIEHVTIYM